MIVKCKKIFNVHTKQLESKSTSLTIGREYIVFEVRIYTNETLYRFVGDREDRMPALYNVSQFDVVNSNISKIWTVSQHKEDVCVLGPTAWQSLEFWDNCYDGDPESLEIYRHEAGIMYAEAVSLLE